MGDSASQSGVKPIIGSTISWADLIKDIAELIGRSPTSGIDSYKYKLSDYASFLATVNEFRTGNTQNPLKIIQNANDILDHLHFGFLMYGKSSLFFHILEQTDLKITSVRAKNYRVAIVTGTLGQWKQAIINILTNKSTSEAQWVFSYCYDFFQSIGLQSVWADYRKKQTGDHTYLLEYKK
ncbi:hypothetical protein LCGC14_0646450 [marine sediment metagenome]|uniref:Uncharacterized protein n=1 Tax=marine sediment metagenome TaxID=412755 RepID=A0A0F9QXM6_9ZZZZ|nr:hypothetical protein [Pricia sp.]